MEHGFLEGFAVAPEVNLASEVVAEAWDRLSQGVRLLRRELPKIS